MRRRQRTPRGSDDGSKPPPKGSTSREVLAHRIAWCALIALAWPSLGPLPYVVHVFGERFETAGDHADHGHHHADPSAIPGTPTHPDDHQCPECEVLKHLARCALAVPALAVLAPVVATFFTRRIVVATRSPADPVHVPPARAPPLAIA